MYNHELVNYHVYHELVSSSSSVLVMTVAVIVSTLHLIGRGAHQTTLSTSHESSEFYTINQDVI
jgi:hypothetical protein